MSITKLLILITISISLYAFKSIELMHKMILSPYRISKNKEFLRLITSGLVHADFTHLFLNMIALYSFGEALESTYIYYFAEKYKIIFLSLYLGGIIVSNIPFCYKYKNNSNYFSLGASGGVNAVVFSCILYTPTAPISLFYFICLPSFIFGFLYIGYTVYFLRNTSSNIINHWAHLIGALYGFVFNLVLEPKVFLFFYYQVKAFLFSNS